MALSWDSPILVEAVLLWMGWGHDLRPHANDSLLVDRFGAKLASELLSLIRSMKDEFYSSNAYTAKNLSEIERIAVAEFKKNHPEVADEIVKAFAWCYTFDWR